MSHQTTPRHPLLNTRGTKTQVENEATSQHHSSPDHTHALTASTPASKLLSKEKLAGWVPHFHDLSNHPPSFDTLTATVKSLRVELSAGRLRSTQLVEEYQRSICLYNEWLGAVYQLSPGAMDQAFDADRERERHGKSLGPLHGIPILIKVCRETRKGGLILK